MAWKFERYGFHHASIPFLGFLYAPSCILKYIHGYAVLDFQLTLLKSAYETLYALLETVFPLFPIPPFFDRIVAGLTDENDIRTICTLILTKLLQLAPEESHSRLDAFADAFRQVLAVKPKENAVKTEIERIQDGQKSVLKVSLEVQKTFGAGGENAAAAMAEDPMLGAWRNYWEWVRKEFAPLMKVAEDEMKEKDR